MLRRQEAHSTILIPGKDQSSFCDHFLYGLQKTRGHATPGLICDTFMNFAALNDILHSIIPSPVPTLSIFLFFLFCYYLSFQTCVFVLHRSFVNLDYTTNHHWAFFEFFMATSLIQSFWGRSKGVKDVCKLRNIKWFFASASNKRLS